MVKYYFILILIIFTGCGKETAKIDKSKVDGVKQSASSSQIEKNIVKAEKPENRKITSQRSKNKNINQRKPVKPPTKKSNSSLPMNADKIKAPDFLLSDLEGNIFDFSEILSDVVILSNVLEHIENRILFLKKIQKLSGAKTFLIRVPHLKRDWQIAFRKELGMYYFSDLDHKIENTLKQFKKEIAANS